MPQICNGWNWWTIAEVKGTRESKDPEVIVEFHEPLVQSFEGREMVQNFSAIFLLAGHRAIARHCNDFVSASTNRGTGVCCTPAECKNQLWGMGWTFSNHPIRMHQWGLLIFKLDKGENAVLNSSWFIIPKYHALPYNCNRNKSTSLMQN